MPLFIFFKKRGAAEMAERIYSALPIKPCRHAGCPELVRGGGYCEKHKTEDRSVKREIQGERGSSARYHNLYFTRRWREMRAAQLVAEPFCRECGKMGRRTRAEDVDHIKPHRGDKRIFYDPANLQSLCHSCHSRKTMEERRHPRPENV